MAEDKHARDAVEQTGRPDQQHSAGRPQGNSEARPENGPATGSDDRPAAAADRSAAGPHARADLTDESKTPGSGALPDGAAADIDAGSE